jgi:hypothetical protein
MERNDTLMLCSAYICQVLLVQPSKVYTLGNNQATPRMLGLNVMLLYFTS